MAFWKRKTYSMILDHLADGIYLVDHDKRIRYWNAAAETLTGYTSEEMIGKSMEDVMPKFLDESGKVMQKFEYPVARSFQEKNVISRVFVIETKDGGRIPVEEKAVPMLDGGIVSFVIASFRDTTISTKVIERRLRNERKERIIPICGWCKKIRSDDNYWEQLETFLTSEGFGIFTHGMCPTCAEKIFEKKVYLESYQNICKSISASISLDEVLKLIVTNVVKIMNVKASSLRLINEEKKQLELVAYHGLSEKYANKGPVSYDASIDDALAGKPVSVYDIEEHKDSRYYREAAEEGIRSILSIPLRFEKDVIGILRMYTTEPVQYTDEDLQFISAIAEQGAIAIINARRFEVAVSKEKEYLRVFEEITKAVSSSLNLEEVLNMIVRKIPEVMKLKGSTLRLLNRDTKQLELVAYYGLSEQYVNKGPVKYDKSIDDALAGKPVSSYDITEHKESRYYKEAVREGIRTILSIPMRFQNNVIGVLRLYSTKPRKYQYEDLRFMSAIAEQTAIAIVNAKHFEKEISKEKEYLEVFQEVTRALSISLKPEEVLDMIVRKIPEVMNLKAATVRLLDEKNRRLELVASYGLSEKYLNKGPVDAEENVIEALKERPVAIYDVTTDYRIQYKEEAKEEGIKSMLTLPIIARGRLLGILRLLTSEHREFSQQEIDFAASLAEQSGIAITNAQYFEKKISKEKEYLRVFEEITKAVNSSLNLKEVLDMIVHKIPEVMNLRACSLRLVNKQTRQLELAAYSGLSERYVNKGPVGYDERFDNIMTEKSVLIYDIEEHKESRYYKELHDEGIRGILSVPMRFQGEVIGRLRVYSDEPVEYTDEDTKFMTAIAEQTANAIINAKHFEVELSKEKQYLKVFQKVTRAVSSSLQPREVLDMIVKTLPEVMNVRAATIRLFDSSGEKLNLVAANGLSERYLSRGPVDAEPNVIEALRRGPVAIYDVTTDNKINYHREAAEEGIKSMLTLPVMARGKVLGILRLLTGTPKEFTREEIDFAVSLAEQCGIFIENALMYEKSKKDYDDIMRDLSRAVI